ncbi:LysR family transcriptional regulator [Arthrobacter sp. SW1]|uniref:LysR family transcriptional regulator n=1 Tax=Arthrobacter sp. SW1 TaxID=1920889 RepID=UPI000877B91A|nr:LysR substrate-binding domain-containing protein [Arthrobacter sp. SW1]OFI39516.1 LysR family transcriptional regulator [Arthrobacter sp. SW1]
MLNIGRLRVLRELHHRKTLSAVAAALAYSTSSVSQQVRLLEKEVGVRLVEPVGRRLQLTPQGLILVTHAEKILDMLERAEADLSTSLQEPTGTVRIAAFQSAAMTFLPKMIRELQDLHPKVTVEFHQGEPEETLPALQSAEYDLAIVESYPGLPVPSVPGIHFETLFEDPLWLAMDQAKAANLTPGNNLIAQLSDAGWAVEAEESAPRTWVINECRKSGFEPRIVCSSEDLAAQLRFVEAGIAVAVLPGLALENAASHVRKFPAARGIQSREVILAARKASRDRPAIEVTVQALRRASVPYLSK